MEKSTAPALLITKIQKEISLSFLDPVPNSVDDLPTRFRVKDYSCGGRFRRLAHLAPATNQGVLSRRSGWVSVMVVTGWV